MLFSVVHLALNVAWISTCWAVGLVLADSVNMLLRIASSFW